MRKMEVEIKKIFALEFVVLWELFYHQSIPTPDAKEVSVTLENRQY